MVAFTPENEYFVHILEKITSNSLLQKSGFIERTAPGSSCYIYTEPTLLHSNTIINLRLWWMNKN